jgi:hypothetical protein
MNWISFIALDTRFRANSTNSADPFPAHAAPVLLVSDMCLYIYGIYGTCGTAEAARKLGISKPTLLRWFAQRRIAEVRRDRSNWRVFTDQDLERIRVRLREMATTRRDSDSPRTGGSRHMAKFLAVDFFCGAGGTTRGLIDAGGYVMAGIDKDARCERTYVENNINGCVDHSPAQFLNYDIFPRSPEYPGGQQRALFGELDKIIRYYRRKAPGLPLLFAICAPCQPFTKLARKEMSDEVLPGDPVT